MNRNIVLIVLDTVRKDYFEDFAPRIKQQAETSFSQCRAASSWSVPSHVSIFTGDLPSQHNIHSESFGSSFDFHEKLGGQTFLDSMSGYSTLGVSSNIYMNREFGFDLLFDEFKDHSIGGHYSAVPFPEVTTTLSSESDSWATRQIEGLKQAVTSNNRVKNICNGLWLTFGDRLEQLPLPRVGDNGAKANAESIREFATETEEPFFAFANFMDAHNPLQNSVLYDQNLHSVSNSWSSNEYDKWELLIEDYADESYTNNYRELYGASIDYLDQVISQLITDLEDTTDNETTIIITADHGHNLGYDYEDGYFHHTASLSEGILHVPLEIINPPSIWPHEIQDMVSQITLPALVRLIKEEVWEEDAINTGPVVAESIGLLGEDNEVSYDGDEDVDHEFWNRMIRVGYEGSVKYEWDSLGNSRSYDLDRQQPCWQSLREQNCEILESILSKFDEDIHSYKSQCSNSSQDLSFSDGVEENLKDLGYL